MVDKKLVRLFPMHCCKRYKSFIYDDFTHDGRMILICHAHDKPITSYITWRSGIDKTDYDKHMEEQKKKKK